MFVTATGINFFLLTIPHIPKFFFFTLKLVLSPNLQNFQYTVPSTLPFSNISTFWYRLQVTKSFRRLTPQALPRHDESEVSGSEHDKFKLTVNRTEVTVKAILKIIRSQKILSMSCQCRARIKDGRKNSNEYNGRPSSVVKWTSTRNLPN